MTVKNRNPASITISWTAVNAADADGYILYIDYLYSDTQSIVTVGNTTQYTLWYQSSLPLYGYNITVRAHQDLLGPPSKPLLIPTINCKQSSYPVFNDFELFRFLVAVTSLTCINNNSRSIVIGVSTPHSLPRKGLVYQVRYYRCDSASLEGNITTVEKTIAVLDLSPNTCYIFTIKPNFAIHVDSEEYSVQCSTPHYKYS